ncbi:carboxymuconolactone decarboxylase family protein (plasmid) [Bartonella sp. HY329]|uniref:carboxymuconolactone decarboxylase family protein n=1 Tax=unclassified Bartonella TaxID=2645622 RepID=UPI0021C9D87C|nr:MULTISPECIES: carboxymuconolactone decarboxylase family protein [unclassified Bartonella]UXM96504.1 carboxymuconolactone decarboxylase family protein [Bartonella sp. HY329]UXN10827.1 carboxymuconolactone decarboxylase family protein [Bartonella sp. HY328]
MTRIKLLDISEAPQEVRPILENAQKNNGFLPNLLRVLANAPAALETYVTVSGINAKASFSLNEREVVQITAAALHGCGFCVAGHTAIALKKAQLPKEVVEALRNIHDLDDPKLNAVARFTQNVIATRGNVKDEDLASFKAVGYNDQAALEVVLGVSLATLCNFANNLGQPPINEQLLPYEWKKQ